MKAARLERYGAPVLREVERPESAADEALVRVRASSVNAVDWYHCHGRPYVGRAMMGVRRPRSPRLGSDFAGVVEVAGAGFAVGDEVFGAESGSYAEYVSAKDAVAHKPANLSFEEAAAVPVAGLTALQGLRDHGGVVAGSRVLVNGASGGVGTFAVQVAVALGAEVHAVCSRRNVEQARRLGASRVLDYEAEDFARSGERYDVIFDNAGNRSWAAMKRVLASRGTVVLVGGPRNPLLGPLGHVVRSKLAAKAGDRTAVFFIAKPNGADLATIAELIESGQVRPIVERRFELARIGEAMRAMDGHARAKLVVTVDTVHGRE